MKRVITMILVATILLAGVAFAEDEIAQMSGKAKMVKQKGKTQIHARMMGMEQKMKMRMLTSFFLNPILKDYLELTDDQVAKLEKIKADHGKKMIDQRAEIAKARIDLKLLMQKSDIDTNAAGQLLQKIAGMEATMKLESLKAFNQAKSTLTAEQKTKIDNLWKGKGLEDLMKYYKAKKMSANNDEDEDDGVDNWMEALADDQ